MKKETLEQIKSVLTTLLEKIHTVSEEGNYRAFGKNEVSEISRNIRLIGSAEE